MYEVWIHICIKNKRMTNLNLSTKLTDRNDVLLMYRALETYIWQVSYFVSTTVIDSLVLDTNAVCFPVGLDTILLILLRNIHSDLSALLLFYAFFIFGESRLVARRRVTNWLLLWPVSF